MLRPMPFPVQNGLLEWSRLHDGEFQSSKRLRCPIRKTATRRFRVPRNHESSKAAIRRSGHMAMSGDVLLHESVTYRQNRDGTGPIHASGTDSCLALAFTTERVQNQDTAAVWSASSCVFRSMWRTGNGRATARRAHKKLLSVRNMSERFRVYLNVRRLESQNIERTDLQHEFKVHMSQAYESTR
jgi:hypothetical protein